MVGGGAGSGGWPGAAVDCRARRGRGFVVLFRGFLGATGAGGLQDGVFER